ncbi:MAG: hypothetical protein ABIO05_00645 [Ferruginibacter sp.]
MPPQIMIILERAVANRKIIVFFVYAINVIKGGFSANYSYTFLKMGTIVWVMRSLAEF